MMMSETFRTCGWGTRIGFSACVGVWTTGLLWLVTRNALAAVFIMGAVLGLYMVENWGLKSEVREMEGSVVELEKQVVALRTSMHEMCRTNADLEAEGRRALSRRLIQSHSSSRSL